MRSAHKTIIKDQETRLKAQQALLDDLDIKNHMEMLQEQKKVLKTHKDAIESQDQRMNDQQAQLNDHDDRVEAVERNDRMGVLIIVGAKIITSNRIRESAIATVKKFLNIELKPDKFLKCYRLQDADDKGTSQIMVRFKDPARKTELMMNRGKLKKKPIYLKEFLTKKQFNIFYQAREAKRHMVVTREGSYPTMTI